MNEQSDIIEIVFESVRLDKSIDFIMETIYNSELISYNCTVDYLTPELSTLTFDYLYETITAVPDGSFYFNFSQIVIEEVVFKHPGVQLLKYNDTYDINVHFESSDLNNNETVLGLQKWSIILAEKLNTQIFYCGYEPAYDHNTRFFSRNNLGPILLA
ncbi:MAG: hypothetical protein JNL32_15465 [Candidatus Kapabacteria bacterium]|nr:hypothetical protein [Candidatus Kapabacteria bacterium]